MSKTTVITEITDNLAIIKLNRPEKHNGVNLEMFKEFISSLKALKNNKQIRAIVIAGNGESFCAGLDFAAVGKTPTKMMLNFFALPWKKVNLYQEFAWAVREMPVPVIAAIHGNCFGAGIQLAAACDFRFATADAKLSFLEAKWGLVPDMSGTISVLELVRLDTAKDLFFTGKIISGKDAQDIGLVSHISETPFEAALEYAQTLCQYSPDAVSTSKRLLNNAAYLSLCKALSKERWAQLKLFRTPNHKIALKAGMKKQKPEFKERC